MAQNFINEADNFKYVATGAIASGALVAFGGADENKTVGVALNAAAAAGDIVIVAHHGGFMVPKASGDAVTQGQKLYFLNGQLTTAADDGGGTNYPHAGYALESALAGDALVAVKLLG